jgi:hypothetical protein
MYDVSVGCFNNCKEIIEEDYQGLTFMLIICQNVAEIIIYLVNKLLL